VLKRQSGCLAAQLRLERTYVPSRGSWLYALLRLPHTPPPPTPHTPAVVVTRRGPHVNYHGTLHKAYLPTIDAPTSRRVAAIISRACLTLPTVPLTPRDVLFMPVCCCLGGRSGVEERNKTSGGDSGGGTMVVTFYDNKKNAKRNWHRPYHTRIGPIPVPGASQPSGALSRKRQANGQRDSINGGGWRDVLKSNCTRFLKARSYPFSLGDMLRDNPNKRIQLYGLPFLEKHVFCLLRVSA